ncbi:hypothetical protein MPTK1_7g03760 [Marchantia polymorpha subsp. ruderalis]|uniref:Uncharacterized protein n=2 Tax=Marchantia polymorpha TaxID=3197 RepID=A0AAF6BVV6_MARPO|nr:hypothetical protein MARPO_0074s0021 [Marchantia polymorpha]BBN16140.1 hypothetical protein Mp_7g03760 [Marchantia polymorpha subsp. ruderalis]|eukprot:PTQ35025.1 hypothetical protein MARPO_0074s0021 [Marchantia polymorpha]
MTVTGQTRSRSFNTLKDVLLSSSETSGNQSPRNLKSFRKLDDARITSPEAHKYFRNLRPAENPSRYSWRSMYSTHTKDDEASDYGIEEYCELRLRDQSVTGTT